MFTPLRWSLKFATVPDSHPLQMDELLVLVSDRIDEDMVVSLWKEEKFDWHTHKDQAAELLLQPEDDPAVPEETKINNPPPHTEVPTLSPSFPG